MLDGRSTSPIECENVCVHWDVEGLFGRFFHTHGVGKQLYDFPRHNILKSLNRNFLGPRRIEIVTNNINSSIRN